MASRLGAADSDHYNDAMPRPSRRRTKGTNVMNDTAIRQIDEEILAYEVADETLEAAGGTVNAKADAFTLSFCSTINSCPGVPSS